MPSPVPSRWLVSADDHIIEPPDLWTSRLPEKYQGACPQVREDDRGQLAVEVLVGGRAGLPLVLDLFLGKALEGFETSLEVAAEIRRFLGQVLLQRGEGNQSLGTHQRGAQQGGGDNQNHGAKRADNLADFHQ